MARPGLEPETPRFSSTGRCRCCTAASSSTTCGQAVAAGGNSVDVASVSEPQMKTSRTAAVLDVRPILRDSQQATVARVLGRHRGVEGVEVNPVAQTATVRYDPARTSPRAI
jgi:hypothetical protein